MQKGLCEASLAHLAPGALCRSDLGQVAFKCLLYGHPVCRRPVNVYASYNFVFYVPRPILGIALDPKRLCDHRPPSFTDHSFPASRRSFEYGRHRVSGTMLRTSTVPILYPETKI